VIVKLNMTWQPERSLNREAAQEQRKAIAAGSRFEAKLARQIPSNPGGQAKNDDVHAKLGCDGIVSNEDADAEVNEGNSQPEPDEDPGTIYEPLIFALVD
jgi:hypothetical protein